MVAKGDVIELKGKEKTLKKIQEARKELKDRITPGWVEPDKELLRGAVKNLPQREDLDFSIEEQLIVELYSK